MNPGDVPGIRGHVSRDRDLLGQKNRSGCDIVDFVTSEERRRSGELPG
jgi:hypothetical protein